LKIAKCWWAFDDFTKGNVFSSPSEVKILFILAALMSFSICLIRTAIALIIKALYVMMGLGHGMVCVRSDGKGGRGMSLKMVASMGGWVRVDGELP
jgi:hypothetical protein